MPGDQHLLQSLHREEHFLSELNDLMVKHSAFLTGGQTQWLLRKYLELFSAKGGKSTSDLELQLLKSEQKES